MASSLRCTTCGAALEPPARRCTTCGEENPAGRALTWVRSCPRCGYQGYGEHYFSKIQHVALLVVLGLVTSGIGALIYWLMRFQHRLCPRCGLNWRHASYRALPHPDASPGYRAGDEALAAYGDPSAPTKFLPPEDRSVQGWLRIGGGALLGFMGTGWISAGAMVFGMGSMPLVMLAGGTAAVGGGAALIWSGIKRLRWRRGSPRQLQRGILRLASQRGGRLTASEVAVYMDLSPEVAKKLLDGMELEDSQRVGSDVTDEGVIVYEFPELLRRPGRRLEGTEQAERHEEL